MLALFRTKMGKPEQANDTLNYDNFTHALIKIIPILKKNLDFTQEFAL